MCSRVVVFNRCGCVNRKPAVSEFWLTVVQVRPSTVNSYRQHVYRYLIPVLGRLRLDELSVHRVQACFDLLARRRTGTGDRISPATVDRIRATLRSALNTAVREGVMAANPMRSVKVSHPVRPHPVVWTDERVAEWRRTGVRPPVAVWTLAQTARFLDAVKDDRLAGVWWLIALRGLRRGEVTGLRRADLDAAAAELSVRRQVVALPGVLYVGPPKSRAGNRTVALDRECAQRLRDQLARQSDDILEHRYVAQRRSDARTRTGAADDESEALFTYADGRPVRPEYLSHQFRKLIKALDLPPIRLHDLRHQAATLALAAHTDLKVIQQMLGHSSIITTADTYTSVLPEVAHTAAQASADLIMRVARSGPRTHARSGMTHESITLDIGGTGKRGCDRPPIELSGSDPRVTHHAPRRPTQ
jgi:integrase